MNELYTAMLELMEEQQGVLTALLDLSRQKSTTLIKNDLEALEKIVHSEQELIFLLGQLEQKRLKHSSDQTATELEADCPPELLERWQATHQKSLYIATELEQLNETNKELLETAIGFVDFMQRLLTPSEPSSGTYGPQGTRQAKKPGYFDGKL